MTPVLWAIAATLLVGLAWAVRTGELRRGRVPVLIYHRIVPREKPLRDEDRDERGCIVYDDEFVEHLAALKRSGFASISPEDFLQFHRGEATLPDKPVLITFDDGWRSVHEFALPALREAGMVATVFINTVDDNPNFLAGDPVDGPMTKAMWRELRQAGISIGSHGATHVFLTTCDDEQLSRELEGSRRVLEEALAEPVLTLAAPGGQSDARVVRAAERAGYHLFFGGGSGTIGRESTLLALPRLGVERDTPGPRLVQNLTPRAIIQHRFIRLLKQLPTRIFGPVASNRLRGWLIGHGLGWAISVRFLKRAMAAGGIALGALLLWILLR